MLVSWSLPTVGFSLWPCVVLLAVFIPVSVWHERNWRRTLAAYAEQRRAAGAPTGEWPPADLALLMGVQPWLVFVVCGILGGAIAIALWAVLQWPQTPAGFELPINPYDMPYIWTMVIAASAAVVAGLAIAIDAARSPWAKVARCIRRSMYASAEQRAAAFASALEADPELQQLAAPASPAPDAPAGDAPAGGSAG